MDKNKIPKFMKVYQFEEKNVMIFKYILDAVHENLSPSLSLVSFLVLEDGRMHTSDESYLINLNLPYQKIYLKFMTYF